MFGVVFYTVAGRYEHGVYKKISLPNITVKFASIKQYSACDFSMNRLLKPFINELINSPTFILGDQCPVNKKMSTQWLVDDVIARRNFFIWNHGHNDLQHVDVTDIVFPKPSVYWIISDTKFLAFMETLRNDRNALTF